MLLFAFTIFTSAFLLFQVQPLVARIVLPWFGGTPAVWTTCQLVFQVLLLGGYGYAHLLSTRLAPRRQALVHGVLVAVALAILGWQAFAWQAPLLPPETLRPQDSLQPIGRIIGILLITVGLPYFVLSTTGPLLQSWFARLHPSRSAWRLYALSNVGSLLALLSYPFVIEPALALRAQGSMWAGLFVAFATGAFVVITLLRRGSPAAGASGPAAETSIAEPETERPRASAWAMWIALSATASVLLLAVTNHISQEVAVVPFLWVLPLALYLITFILCFESDRWYTRSRFLPLLAAATLAVGFALYRGNLLGIAGQISTYLAMLFVGAMVCHGEMVRLKPSTRHLTAFYLAMSIGGALGGVLVGLVAPAAFKAYWELHVSVLAVWVLVLLAMAIDRGSALYGRWAQPARASLAFGLLGTVLLLVSHAQSPLQDSVEVSRNFYGVLEVFSVGKVSTENHAYGLRHGKTVHGVQYLHPDRRRLATTYYSDGSGIERALRNHPRAATAGEGAPGLHVGVVGLGVGTLAAYSGPHDRLRFYEINPEVVRLAQGDGGYFSYLGDALGRVEMVMGDARISLERELREQGSLGFDVLAIDAFSSDSIPVHLVTREAIALYTAHLAPDGILAIHISNRFLDLGPVVWRLADEAQLYAAIVNSADDEKDGYVRSSSAWMLLTRDPSLFELPGFAEGTQALTLGGATAHQLWTDDYSALLPTLRL